MSNLMKIQQELKAPKNQRNSFGGYNYRSCEDILEAVKPLLKKYECMLTISDEMIEIGGRVYVKATARFADPNGGGIIEVSANAREAQDRKGMDDSQITGATSSYARKYALNGLFCIDDTKDADATNQHNKELEKPFNGKTLTEIERELKSCKTKADLVDVYEDNEDYIQALKEADKVKLRATYKSIQDKLKEAA